MKTWHFIVALGIVVVLALITPNHHPTVHLQTSAAKVATPLPTPTPAPVTNSPESPQTQAVTEGFRTGPDEPQASATPAPTPVYQGTWTPYNPHCFSDCYPDLTPAEIATPTSPHYACEAAAVLGDPMKGC